MSLKDQMDSVNQRYQGCQYAVRVTEYFLPDPEWMMKNIQGRWYCEKLVFRFETEREAMMFSLKFL